MSSVKKIHPRGVITFHTSFPVSLLKIEESIPEVENMTKKTKSPSQPNVKMKSSCRPAKKNEGKPSSKQDRLFYTSLEQLQANIEDEQQEAQEVIQTLLDKEKSFKELESFLNQQDVAKQRRKELFHRRWTERVWLPLQRRVEEHVSSCWPVVNHRRQSMYNHYLRHCSSKGFVFLETYDLQEYNPFLLNISNPQHFKDAMCLQLQETHKKKRISISCEAGHKNTQGTVQRFPKNQRFNDQLPHPESVDERLEKKSKA